MSEYYILSYTLDDGNPILAWGDEESSGFYKPRMVENRKYSLLIGEPRSDSIDENDMYWIGRPVVSNKMKKIICDFVADRFIQFVNVEIEEVDSDNEYFIAHFLKKENCVDLELSLIHI